MKKLFSIEERPTWRWWVTPRLLEEKPIHRWYIFPHSFTSELVHAMIEEWGLEQNDHILDPFSGAGTTLLAAKEKRIPASGYDLLPLAVLSARTKTANLSPVRLAAAWKSLQKTLNPDKWNGTSRTYPELVNQALPGKLLGAFDTIARQIDALACSSTERGFFRLALLTVLPHYSQAVATGGWLKWLDRKVDIGSIPEALNARIETMLGDLHKVHLPRTTSWRVEEADARVLPDKAATYSAVITSPPYPNRHDYTRVLGVELMFAFLDWEGTRKLRYQSFHSHPESRPERLEANDYTVPQALIQALKPIKKAAKDPRVPRMLEGYFLDMYLCLREVKRVCLPGAKIAFIVGNAQYYGESIFVDELTAEVGEQAGLICKKIIIARWRGNSAQQMGKYGRRPSRESVVLFRSPES